MVPKEHVLVSPSTRKNTSVWDSFDISKLQSDGCKLKYVTSKMVNGVLIGTIDSNNIKQNFSCCGILCSGGTPPYSILNGFVKCMWSTHGIDKAMMMKNRLLLARFNTSAAGDKVLGVGVLAKPFLECSWYKDIEFSTETLDHITI